MDQYAVFGNPIAHSKSPLIHRAFAEQTGQSLDYKAILAPLDGFAQAVREFQQAGGKGFNVTVPFKQEAWTMVHRRSRLAERAGAVNTVSCNVDGTLSGDNTDGVGIVRDLQANLSVALRAKRVLVVGAGGAVRGILEPLADCQPDRVVIANRTPQKAIELADLMSDLGAFRGVGFDDLAGERFDVVINGTAASLQNELPPLPPECVRAAICYDMMYGKAPTLFMQWAMQNGAARVHDGLGMLVEQAAEAFFIWRGVRPETGAFLRRKVLDAL